MELMATCLEKLMKHLKEPIPESILGKVAVAVCVSYIDVSFLVLYVSGCGTCTVGVINSVPLLKVSRKSVDFRATFDALMSSN